MLAKGIRSTNLTSSPVCSATRAVFPNCFLKLSRNTRPASTRTTFCKMARTTFLAFLLVVLSLTANAQRNTILIIADDRSPDYFGFYGNTLDTVDAPTSAAC